VTVLIAQGPQHPQDRRDPATASATPRSCDWLSDLPGARAYDANAMLHAVIMANLMEIRAQLVARTLRTTRTAGLECCRIAGLEVPSARPYAFLSRDLSLQLCALAMD
jgi:hypothetical protein